jgi:hypothetical protein
MKTFSDFMSESFSIMEMRKEDKVKGKKKTPLFIEKKSTTVTKAPEGSGKRWNIERHTEKKMSQEAQMGRFKQGRYGWSPAVQGGGGGGAGYGYKPQPHGSGGRLRGVKKKDQPRPPEPKKSNLSAHQRRVEVSNSKRLRLNPDNHIVQNSYIIGGAAAKAKAERAKKSFGNASKAWSEKEKASKSKPSEKKSNAKSRMAAAAERLGLKD